MSEITDEIVREAAETLRQPPVVTVERVSPGKNTIFVVSYADQETVLKLGTATPDRVRAEAAVVRFVAAQTTIPVPAVLAAGEEPLPVPFVLFERVAGRTVGDLSPELSSNTRHEFATTAGQHLAALHAAETFDAAGSLVAGSDGLQPTAESTDWQSLFEKTLRAKIGQLPSAFDTHAGTIDAAVAWATATPGAYGDCVPTHLDYRPANVVLSPGDDTDADPVVAVLDWGGAAAAPAAYEIAHTEALLTAWPDGSKTAREHLRAGYRAVAGSVPAVPDAARIDAVLRLAKHLERVVACRGVDREMVVDELIDRLRALGDTE